MTQVSGGTLWLGEGNSLEKNTQKKKGVGVGEETNWTEFNKYNKQKLTRSKRCKPVDYFSKIPMDSEITSNKNIKL